MDSPCLGDAVRWIAENVHPGASEPVAQIEAYATVGMAADLFGVSRRRVALLVHRQRKIMAAPWMQETSAEQVGRSWAGARQAVAR